MRGLPAVVLVAGAGLAAAPCALATPPVWAHRGGAIVDRVPAYAENTMPAFRHAAAQGFVLALDVKLTRDGVPVVFHDATLDRTTNCTGLLQTRTAAELAACKVQWLGRHEPSDPASCDAAAAAPPLSCTLPYRRLPAAEAIPIPTLAEVLAFAQSRHARVAPAIENVPGDRDFDPGRRFATTVVDAIKAAGFPPSLLTIQSFWPPDLRVSEQLLPGAARTLLTSAATDAAAASGFESVSPAYGAGLAPRMVEHAHARGRKVIPYTLDTPAQVSGAARAGVDEVITDDGEMARSALAAVAPAHDTAPPAPAAAECARLRADRNVPPIQAYDPRPGAPRVFAMQFKQDLRFVTSYRSFRAKIECMIRDVVVPRLAPGRPNVVAFNEDIGLMTIATGSRGAAARGLFADPRSAPSCESQGVPCGAVAALGAVTAAYAPQLAAYRARFPAINPVSGTFVAATDTFARGFMQTFSDMARRYGVYILGSSDQAPFRESTDPSEIALFKDPDEPTPQSVYVATSDKVYNEVFMWGPRDVRSEGPYPLRNLVARNRKVPITPIEEQFQFTNGPATGPDAIENARPYALPGTRARIGFATSLPAFRYGDGAQRPAPGHECDDVSVSWMRCIDRLGANLVIQDEANPGRWADNSGCGGACWQPLEWMTSTWRTVSDPTVGFDYNVTPMMVGSLADLTFDGQSAITQRALTDRSCAYVGTSRFEGGDPQNLRGDAGPKPEFLALTPWAAPDGPRPDLRATAAKLAPGSGDPRENDYLETAIAADLPFPPDPVRGGCLRESDVVAPVARLSAPRIASDNSRSPRFGVRFRGSDTGGSGIVRYTLEARRLDGRPNQRWRVVARTGRTAARFTGRAGATYRLQLRASDRAGNDSRATLRTTIVPVDQTSARIRLGARWRRSVGSRGAYGGSVARARSSGATAWLRFRGTQLAVIAPTGPHSPGLLVAIDGGPARVVRLSARHRRSRAVVLRSRRLRPGRHRLVLRALGLGAELDALAVGA